MDDNNASKKVAKIIIILSIIIAAISMYILIAIELPTKPLSGQGGAPEEDVKIGGSFILTDQNGDKFNSDAMNGKLSLVYFGFTFCPDICPTSLQKLTQVLSTLDKYQIDVLPIFITVDPSRDTPELLKEYLGHFHGKFVGLTGSEEQIKEVADLYKVFYAVAEGATTEDDKYMLDHSSFVYLMDKNGKYMKHFYMSSTPKEIIEYIRINK
jgi:protein SCO1/2